MKRIFLFLSVLSVFLLGNASAVSAQQNLRTIEVGLLTTTHILFTSDLTYVDITMNKYIVGKVVDASKNMLAIKAREKFDFVTTISALEANGTMHTFYVKFNPNPSELVIDTRLQDQSVVAQVNTQIRPETSEEPVAEEINRKPSIFSGHKKDNSGHNNGKANNVNPPTGVTVTTDQTSNFGRANAPTLQEVMRKDRSLYHLVDKKYGLTAYVTNIYAYSDLTYIVIAIENNTDIGYKAGDAQFTVETKRQSAKQLATDKPVWIKSSFGSLSCPPNSRTMICYSIPKLTLQENETLKVYVYEKGGARNMFLILDDKDVNYAVSPI